MAVEGDNAKQLEVQSNANVKELRVQSDAKVKQLQNGMEQSDANVEEHVEHLQNDMELLRMQSDAKVKQLQDDKWQLCPMWRSYRGLWNKLKLWQRNK